MKRILLFTSALCLSTLSIAQIYETNFDAPVSNDYLTKGDFRVGQAGSDLVIFSQGHDEWRSAAFTFNDANGMKTITLSKEDTIYVRAKAIYTNAYRPKFNIGLQDTSGISPNNEQYNAVNSFTLSNEYQVFKFAVPNWNMTWGDPANPNLGKDMDFTQVSKITFGINTGFASQINKNEDGDTIKGSFLGTVYIDYVSFGVPSAIGATLPIVSGHTQEFDAPVSLEAPGSFVTSVSNGALSIESAGHGEWDAVRYTLDEKVDLTSNKMIEFTASATKAAEYTGPVGVTIVAVDESGKRLEPFVLYSLTSESKTIQIPISEFRVIGDSVNGTRIAFVDILINIGFASAPQLNDMSEPVDAAFQGTILFESIKLGTDVVPAGINIFETNRLALGVYPNPATSNINLDNSFVGSTYSIFNSNGMELETAVLDGVSISTETLEKGLYIIKVNKDNQLFTTSFMKK